MKNFFNVFFGIIILILCTFIGSAFGKAKAETFVITDKATGEIISVSPADDAILEDGQAKTVLEKEYIDLGDVTDYKLIDGKFVENIPKISAEENAKLQGQARQAEEAMIMKEAKRLAYESLVAKGIKFTVVMPEDFK